MFIEISTFLVAAALAAVGSLTFWPVKHGYDFYIPIVLFIAFYLAMIAIWWIIIDCYGRFAPKKDKNKVNKLARFFFMNGNRYIDNHALAIVKITGKDKLPKNQRFLFIQNHTSKFDSMVTSGYLGNYDLAFISKPSNFKIPLASHLMPRLYFQAIDREDPIQSLSVMKRSIDLISNNITSIGVYPEGTRHEDEVLGEFHEGVFNIALKAKCPIVVTTIKNTIKVHKDFPLKWTKVYLDIIEVIPYEDIEGKTAKEVSLYAHQLMKENLDKRR